MARVNKNKIQEQEEICVEIKVSEYNTNDIEVPVENENIENNSNEAKYDTWINYGNKKYFPSERIITTKKIPCGYYKLFYDSQRDLFGVEAKSYISDEVLNIPNDVFDNVINDIKKFWSRRDMYVKYKLLHKRGILLYGPQGCGKSFIIKRLIKDVIEVQKGIVFSVNTADELVWYTHIISKIRDIEPDRPIIVMMEDCDSLTEQGTELMSLLLNTLDGINQCENIVYILTTNYPEKLQERLINRPSRVDRRYEIELPTFDVRKFYLENFILDKDIVDINKIAADTEGFSLAHLREFIASHIIMGNDYDESIQMLRDMANMPTSNSTRKKAGFSGGK